MEGQPLVLQLTKIAYKFKLRGEKENDPFVGYERSLFIGLYNMPE